MYLNYVHNFRGLAILLVVAGHCFVSLSWARCPTLSRIMSSVLENGTVPFVFISGFLFQHLSHKFEYTRYLRKKLRNIILPYVIISVPAVLMAAFHLQSFDLPEQFYWRPLSVRIVWLYLTGDHYFHFWFIPMIAIFFLISPLLMQIDKEDKYHLLPLLILISLLVTRDKSNPILQNFLHFCSVYVFGMWCSRHKERVFSIVEKWKYPCLLLILAFLVFEVTWASESRACIKGLRYAGKMLVCPLALLLLRKYDHVIRKKFDYLASVSFGIYFVHGYGIWLCKKLLCPIMGETGVLTLVFFSVSVTALSCGAVWAIKRICSEKSRLVVGC